MSATHGVINRCGICGGAFRHYRGDGLTACPERCGQWANRNRMEQVITVQEAHLHRIAGMMAHFDRVQRQRPSHAAWEGS